ncbi:tbc-domain-containing protein [Lichtheimia corymbifera JMRC:FSU:9682]|uniref:Tbc-domain-containing protein n=1 Tax=Lichtheimia corymbifera JMRC:FSU:9682 TaxID=1263082 RepID=A0A068S250_9FUNG|nr:tbc-domain-containing protein [Lichtheimia corymbifera JMRC:FSU:9682]
MEMDDGGLVGKAKSMTKFSELLHVAFTDFCHIDDDTVREMRQRHQLKVVASIESSAKRSTIRNLDTTAGLSPDELSSLYDIFHNVQYYHESQESNMDYACFEALMGKLTAWAKILPRHDDQHERQDKVGRSFLMRLFNLFDRGGRGSLSFQDIVIALGGILKGDHNAQISLFFKAHDPNQNGYLEREQVLQFSETLLWIFRDTPDERPLDSVSEFLRCAFMYSENKAHRVEKSLSLASLRMIVLADELLMDFFTRGFADSFKLLVHKTSISNAEKRRSFTDILDGLFALSSYSGGESRSRLGSISSMTSFSNGKESSNSVIVSSQQLTQEPQSLTNQSIRCRAQSSGYQR